MTTKQIVAALKTAAKPGSRLEVLMFAAADGNGDKHAVAECVALWIAMGGSAPKDPAQ